jgi:hypothetical protein
MAKKHGKGNDEFGIGSILVYTSKWYLHAVKSYGIGSKAFTSPPKEGVLRIFIAFKIPSPSAACEPAILGSNNKHANHCTIKATFNYLDKYERKSEFC